MGLPGNLTAGYIRKRALQQDVQRAQTDVLGDHKAFSARCTFTHLVLQETNQCRQRKSTF